MRLTKHTIRIVIVLSVTALLGLLALQVVLLKNAYELREQAFARNVNAALNAAVQKLETTEAVGNVLRVAVTAPKSGKQMTVVRIESDSLDHDAPSGARWTTQLNLPQPHERMPVQIKRDTIMFRVFEPQHVTLRIFDMMGKLDTLLVDDFKDAGDYHVRLRRPELTHGEFVLKYWMDSTSYTMHAVNGEFGGMFKNSFSIERREELVGRVIDNLALMEREPVERRIDPDQVDSAITTSLHEAGIDLPFVFGILPERGNEFRLVRTPGYEEELRESNYRVRLFPNDFLFSRNQLVIHFPEQNVFLLKQVGPFLGLTALFMSVIVGCFVYTIRTLVRQKDFGVRLVDFINNMTHEFKTPISTISVAAETMSRPDVLPHQEKVVRYTSVIQEENARMKKQVDKILQMAVLEEGDYELKRIPIDVHDVIRRAIEHITIHVETKGGVVEQDLLAEQYIVNADPVHLSNIIYNLLDNANKYSPDQPKIRISTETVGSALEITITDNGIGIAKEDQGRVFEKYFRVHTGNIHNVKGFGLGLAYVKLMVEAHNGTVSLESTPGNGTTVRLRFPVLR